MNILTGEFLSIEEVAIYLEKTGDPYDLEKQHEYKRLYSKIYDLITQHNISAVFHYYGMLQEEIEEVEYDEDLYTGEPVRIPIYREVNNIHTNTHYYVDTSVLKKILINEERVEVNNYISKYGDVTSNSQSQEVSYYLYNSTSLSSRNIRIPKYELDSLFQKDVSTDIKDKPVLEEGINPKDSAYYLIAILKNLLLDPNTTPYMFKTDNQKSSNQPTQTGLAEHIDGMNIKGLKARNINGIFSDANRLLNDARKN